MSDSGLKAVRRVVVVSTVDVVVVCEHFRNDNILPLFTSEMATATATAAAVRIVAVDVAVGEDVIVQLLVVAAGVQKVGLRRRVHTVEQTVLPDGRVALNGPGDVVLVAIAA